MNLLLLLKNRLKKILYPKFYSFSDSKSYWEQRYRIGLNSGSGSYGQLAKFKADILNNFVKENSINSVIEFGCGDGNQLSLYRFKSYIGLDVSRFIVARCKKKFYDNKFYKFYHYDEYEDMSADLSMSIDVIFHLIEDEVYEDYMDKLFSSSSKFVVIYSSNTNENSEINQKHVKHREFTEWVNSNKKDFKLIKVVKNKFPYDDSDSTSFSDFYFYTK